MSTCHVLIIDDDPLLSEGLGEVVARAFRTRISTGHTLADAHAALRDDIDFAFLDVDLADGATYEFASLLARHDIPFAFVSASDRANMPVGLRSAPFISKPFMEHEILDVLRSSGKCVPS